MALKSSKLTTAVRVVGLVGGLGAFALALRSIPLDELRSLLATSFNLNFVAALIIWVLGLIFEAYRWQVMVNQRKHLSLLVALRLDAFNRLTNLVLPFRAGEAVRVMGARKQIGIDTAYLVATIVNERVFNTLLLSLIALMLTWMVPQLGPFRLVAVAVNVALLFGALWFLKNGTAQRGDNKVELKTEGMVLKARLSDHWQRFVAGTSILRNPRVFTRVTISSVASWCLIWLALFLLLRNYSPDQPVLAAWTLWLIMNVATLLPVTPSNLGPFQWACILALSFFGVSQTEAVAFSMLLLAVRVPAALIIGLAGMLPWLASGLKQKKWSVENSGCRSQPLGVHERSYCETTP